ncbi:hypothetical protein PLESTB_001395000 [Pleodorina starrii]|uniref:Uncharacterized protein n=1 Tax=Pleodorina starrii TaxID=330485 RepID=A0A9W6BV17_9CHLO|nr:hypothetical protein PLESTM_000537300 [Pleodorina starrii]GLC58734.1 hypothetical protein PLESTB_001395000 [Pleodorina starrii]GLC75181.1 hypothetical protein PLESTF_001604100 [Pleodorina starrii]
MRASQQRGWLTGLGQAWREPWRHFSRAQYSTGAQVVATNAGERTESDGAFLQLISQSFMPSVAADSSPSSSRRPLLANLPAAAELMERATVPTPSSQPLYDLPTFLETSYPQNGVRPRSPGYDWRTWARKHAASAAQTQLALDQQQKQQQLEERLALLLQMDAHMQLPASRQALLRIAKLELAHLWHHHQQQQLPGGVLAGGEVLASCGPTSGVQEVQQAATVSASGADTGPREMQQIPPQREGGDAVGEIQLAATGAATAPGAAAASVAVAGDSSATSPAGDAVADGDEDDIFAAADRRARARAQQQQQQQQDLQRQQELKQQQQQQAAQQEQQQRQLAAQGAASRDPLSVLPADLQLRLRELHRRAEAYGATRGGSLPAVVRGVAEAFGQRVSYSYGKATPGAAGGALDPSTASQLAVSLGAGTANGLRRRQTANPADLQLQRLQQSDLGVPSPSYWADHPLLSYGDNVVALAVRQSAVLRQEAAGGPDGKSRLAAAVASLSASSASLSGRGRVRGPGGCAASSAPPPTPVLSLLMDYLQTKYMDLLHTWEVAARLREATERAERQAERQAATMTVQVGELLPAALREQLAGSWAAAAAAFRPQVLEPLLLIPGAALTEAQRRAAKEALTAPLDWSRAAEAMGGTADTDAAAAAAAAGDMRGAVQHALAPVLAAAAARHQALLAGRGNNLDGVSGGGVVAAASTGAGRPTAPAPAPPSSAASVACFRETLVLDASSAFEDSSHDCRVTLEFDVDRLVASEPGLGGAWGARLLERLLAPPLDASGRRRSAPGGSMAGRARRGAAARAALLAKVYPVDVEPRFCRRTRTASLTTGRYPSREANRKLLSEHYSVLLRAVALAAGGGAGGGTAAAQ